MSKRGHDHKTPHIAGDCICVQALRETYRRGHCSGGPVAYRPPGASLWACRYCGAQFGGVLHPQSDSHDDRHEVLGDAHLVPCLPRWQRLLIDAGISWLRREPQQGKST